MLAPLSRRALVAAALLPCVLAPRSARADVGVNDVHIDADEKLQVFDKTNDVTMVPVSYGRYGTRTEPSPIYASVCTTTPCDTTLVTGVHTLALSRPGGPLVVMDQRVFFKGGTALHVTYHDHSAWRFGGAVVAFATPAIALSLMVLIKSQQMDCTGNSPQTVIYNGVPIATGYVPGIPVEHCIVSDNHDVGLGVGAGVLLTGIRFRLDPWSSAQCRERKSLRQRHPMGST